MVLLILVKFAILNVKGFITVQMRPLNLSSHYISDKSTWQHDDINYNNREWGRKGKSQKDLRGSDILKLPKASITAYR